MRTTRNLANFGSSDAHTISGMQSEENDVIAEIETLGSPNRLRFRNMGTDYCDRWTLETGKIRKNMQLRENKAALDFCACP